MGLAEQIIKNRYSGDPKDLLEYTPYDFISDMLTIPDLDKAVKLLQKHINNSLIACIIDIDCDGIMSGALLYQGLLDIGIKKENLKLIIGSRKEGRGVNDYIIKKYKNIENKLGRKFDLIITADHGTTDEFNYKLLKNDNPNLNIIITDHHTVEYDNYPTTVDAFINPQRNDCSCFKDICGCATAMLLFIRYLYVTVYKDIQDQTLFISEDIFYKLDRILPYATIATISDIMPMNSRFNRLLVHTGLDLINNSNNLPPVWDNIREILNLPNDIYEKDVSMYIAPFINTGNRLSIEELALASILITNADVSLSYLATLQERNKERKRLTGIATKEALDDLDRFNYPNSIVCFINSPAMVNGVVAGNLGSMFQVPAISFGLNPKNNKYLGSGRAGIDGLDILSILTNIANEYPDFELEAHGHKEACGCSIAVNKIEEFKEVFERNSKAAIDSLPVVVNEAEFYLPVDEINIYTASLVRRCGPYGMNFKEPIFTSDTFRIVKVYSYAGAGYRLTLNIKGKYFNSVYFFKTRSSYGINNNNIKDILKPGMNIKLLFNLSINYYNNVNSTILDIIDIVI